MCGNYGQLLEFYTPKRHFVSFINNICEHKPISDFTSRTTKVTLFVGNWIKIMRSTILDRASRTMVHSPKIN